MNGPFPEVVQVPTGLTTTRLVGGIPPLALAALALLTVGPIVLLGTWWLTPLTAALGGYIVYEAAQDPDFLVVWAGELRFRTLYQ